jgi:hypothetical protein
MRDKLRPPIQRSAKSFTFARQIFHAVSHRQQTTARVLAGTGTAPGHCRLANKNKVAPSVPASHTHTHRHQIFNKPAKSQRARLPTPPSRLQQHSVPTHSQSTKTHSHSGYVHTTRSMPYLIPNCEAKSCLAGLVLAWGTSREPHGDVTFFFLFIFPRFTYSLVQLLCDMATQSSINNPKSPSRIVFLLPNSRPDQSHFHSKSGRRFFIRSIQRRRRRLSIK